MSLRKVLSIVLLAALVTFAGPWCSGPCCPAGGNHSSSTVSAPSCCEQPSAPCAPTLVRGEAPKLAVSAACPIAWTAASMLASITAPQLALVPASAAPAAPAPATTPPRLQLRI